MRVKKISVTDFCYWSLLFPLKYPPMILHNMSSISAIAGSTTVTFWYHMKDGQGLFLNFRDILETMPS